MARIEFSEDLFDDFERFRSHLEMHDVSAADVASRIGGILSAVEILRQSPELGRAVGDGKRELVIGSGSSGYVVLYRFARALNLVVVLAARHQREDAYARRK